MSALPRKRTLELSPEISALCQKSGLMQCSKSSLFDHLVGGGNSCAYRGRASPTKCGRSIGGECLANDFDRPGGKRRAGIGRMYAGRGLNKKRPRCGSRRRFRSWEPKKEF